MLKRQLIILGIVLIVPIVFLTMEFTRLPGCDYWGKGDPNFKRGYIGEECEYVYALPFGRTHYSFWKKTHNISDSLFRFWIIAPVAEKILQPIADNSWIRAVVLSIPKGIRLPLLEIIRYSMFIPFIAFWMLILNGFYILSKRLRHWNKIPLK